MLIAVDTETTGLDLHYKARPFLVSTTNEEGQHKWWEWRVDPKSRTVLTPHKDLLDVANYLSGNTLVFHNAKFDLLALSLIGLGFHFDSPSWRITPTLRTHACIHCPTFHDTICASHAYDSLGTRERKGRHGLKELALYYLDISMRDEQLLKKATTSARARAKSLGWSRGTDLHGRPKVEYDYWMPKAVCEAGETAPKEWSHVCLDYALKDTDRTIQLWAFLDSALRRADVNYDTYLSERDLIPVTYEMEGQGVPVIPCALDDLYSDFEREASNKKSQAETIASKVLGKPVNVNSHDQLVETLQEGLGYSIPRITKGGKPSTDEECLREAAQYAEFHGDYLLAAFCRIMIGRSADREEDNTEVSTPGYRTYIGGVRTSKSYMDRVSPNGRLYFSMNQSGTVTSRYSSEGGQNISKKAILPMRSAFGPPKGYLWIARDYSQLELRIFAYLSQDDFMIDAFEKGHDFHHYVAVRLFDSKEITPEQRTQAKAMNFKAIYGGINNVPQEYGDQFPKAREFMDSIISHVRRKGYVTLPDGYRLSVPTDSAYKGVDYLVQGTAGRIIKNAMRSLHYKGVLDWKGSSLLLQIHDELLFSFQKNYPWRAIDRKIALEMEGAGARMGIPTPTDAKLITTNWAEGEPL